MDADEKMNMRSRTVLFLLAFTTFLSGCIRNIEIPHGLTPDQLKESNSIVVLSTGATSTRNSTIL